MLVYHFLFGSYIRVSEFGDAVGVDMVLMAKKQVSFLGWRKR